MPLYGDNTLANLAATESKILNPYAGMTAGQYAQDMSAYGNMVRNNNLTQRKDQFGSWLQQQAQSGNTPSRLDVASRVAPFDQESALKVLWEKTSDKFAVGSDEYIDDLIKQYRSIGYMAGQTSGNDRAALLAQAANIRTELSKYPRGRVMMGLAEPTPDGDGDGAGAGSVAPAPVIPTPDVVSLDSIKAAISAAPDLATLDKIKTQITSTNAISGDEKTEAGKAVEEKKKSFGRALSVIIAEADAVKGASKDNVAKIQGLMAEAENSTSLLPQEKATAKSNLAYKLKEVTPKVEKKVTTEDLGKQTSALKSIMGPAADQAKTLVEKISGIRDALANFQASPGQSYYMALKRSLGDAIGKTDFAGLANFGIFSGLVAKAKEFVNASPVSEDQARSEVAGFVNQLNSAANAANAKSYDVLMEASKSGAYTMADPAVKSVLLSYRVPSLTLPGAAGQDKEVKVVRRKK